MKKKKKMKQTKTPKIFLFRVKTFSFGKNGSRLAVTWLGNIDLLMTEKPSLDMPSLPNGKFPYLLLNLVEVYPGKLSRARPMH